MADVDDQQIRTLLKRNPRKALSMLYDFYYRRLSFLAFRYTRDEAVADDLVQQAFLTIWKKRVELSNRHEGPIGKYMESIIYTLSKDYFNRQSRLDDIDALLLIKDFPEEDSDQEDLRIEQVRAMRSEIATFTPREQQCILLKIDHGMSPDEIAEYLGISRKMVEKCNTSVNKKLAAWASEYRRRYM